MEWSVENIIHLGKVFQLDELEAGSVLEVVGTWPYMVPGGYPTGLLKFNTVARCGETIEGQILVSDNVYKCVKVKLPSIVIYYGTRRCTDYDKLYNETREFHVLAELRSLSVKERMIRTRIMQLQEFSAGTVFVCWGMEVIFKLGTPLKRTPCVHYETQESTTDRYPTTGRLYLPEYKLQSMSKMGYSVVRYNGHHVAKDGMKYADEEALTNEKDIRLEPLPLHGQSQAWMRP